ncbi:hypothetical protein [Massilia sp. TN1-12]|uniref:hypothetical protein n=1 Tax=Massilia paldalensis TaxID=3377675 RepID=UPI00384C9505
MQNPIKAARKRKDIRSNDALAGILMDTYPGVFTIDNPRTLSKMIGALDRGDPTWWLNRPDETQHLVEYLELDINDLNLEKKTGRHTFAPPMFPDFPALALQREATWVIGEAKKMENNAPVGPSRYYSKPTLDFWLTPGALGVGPSQTQWLYVPDHIEFDLLTRKLDAVSHHHVVFEATLDGVLDKHLDYLHHQKPLVVVLRDDATGEALQLVMQHRQGAPLLIISPWPMPSLPEANASVQGRGAKLVKRLELESWVWTLLPNWRELLLTWVEQRLNKAGTETSFSSAGAQQLLNKFDPSGQWFTQVEDVLVLAQAVSEQGERKLAAAVGRGTDLSALLNLLFNRKEADLSLTERLVQARWTSWHLPWSGELSQDDWATLANGVCQFDVLLAHFITRTGSAYDFKRPVVIRLLLRNYLTRQLIEGKVGAWMPACFDEQRRPFLDAAFDALSISELEGVAVHLGTLLADPAYLGAGEALFAAVGRRLVRGETMGNTLPRLLGPVVSRLRREQDVLIPYSRALHTPASQVEWIAICWAWSLRTEPCDGVTSSWQFPSWFETLPDTVPNWLNSYGASYSSYSWDRLPLPLHDFLRIVRHWLTMLETAPQYDKMAPVFVAGLLAQAANKAWVAQPDWWYAVIGNPGAEQALLDVVVSDRARTNHEIALAWWPSLVAYRHRQFDQSSSQSSQFGAGLFTRHSADYHYSPLLAWVMEQLEQDAERALSELANEDLVFLARHPGLLSTPFKRQLLTSVPTMQGLSLFPFEIAGFLFAYGPDTSLDMEALLDHPDLGRRAAECLWNWAPRKAALLLSSQHLPPLAIKNLLVTSPPSAVGAALAALRQDTQLLTQTERSEWAKDRLPDARQHAPELLKLVVVPHLTAVV